VNQGIGARQRLLSLADDRERETFAGRRRIMKKARILMGIVYLFILTTGVAFSEVEIGR
jgi:hypothetical protein